MIQWLGLPILMGGMFLALYSVSRYAVAYDKSQWWACQFWLTIISLGQFFMFLGVILSVFGTILDNIELITCDY